MTVYLVYRREKVNDSRESIYCLDTVKGEYCTHSNELELLPMACVNNNVEIKTGLDKIVSLKKHRVTKEEKRVFNDYPLNETEINRFMRDYLIYKSNIEENLREIFKEKPEIIRRLFKGEKN